MKKSRMELDLELYEVIKRAPPGFYNDLIKKEFKKDSFKNLSNDQVELAIKLIKGESNVV